MKKYFSIFKISFAQEFAYRMNFIMWRVRNVLQIFLVFFLWDVIFSDPTRELFGYDRAKILTYVFGLIVVKAIVLSSRAIDVANEISQGELSFKLLKPVSYLKYWLTRDLSSKALNIGFAIFETTFLFYFLKPPFFLQADPSQILGFLLVIGLAIMIYFFIVLLVSFIPLWAPEVSWGGHFLITFVLVESLSGALFPIDILPQVVQKILYFTPFPYLIFFPLQVYLGKIQGIAILEGVAIAAFWVLAFFFLVKSVWKKGLIAYQAYGQ